MSKKSTAEEIHASVRQHYAQVVESVSSGCCGPTPCCGTSSPVEISKRAGYTPIQIKVVPEESNLGLGCGNPTAIAALKPGERVLDLGSGAGFDCFLAAKAVGESGYVIGVDMTPEMVAKARANAHRSGYKNVEFRLGEIERLPIESHSVDVIISNCVVNLAPDKHIVLKEAFRVLKPGGRLAITDIVAKQPVPETIRNDAHLWSRCAAGALPIDDWKATLSELGFKDINIKPIEHSADLMKTWSSTTDLRFFFTSAEIEAIKPLA